MNDLIMFFESAASDEVLWNTAIPCILFRFSSVFFFFY
jgi:hypothetical protein